MNRSSLFLQVLLRVLLTGILLLPMTQARAQSALDYLPLAVGKEWVMHSDEWYTDISFEVIEYGEGVYKVRLNNPWIFWEYGLMPFKDRVYADSFAFGDGETKLSGYSSLFDFNLAIGETAEVALGTLERSSNDKVVTTQSRTYEHCVEFRLISADGFEQRWTFAPGVGFVEYRLGDGRFLLDESRSLLTGAPEESYTLPAAQPLPRGDRTLSLDVQTAENGDFMETLAMAQAIGIQEIGMHMEWWELEIAPGSYDTFFLEVANLVYPTMGISINLTIAPVHNVRNTMPVDLQGLPFDDPQVIARFKQMLDVVFAKLPDITLTSLVVGSEVDGFLLDDAEKWQEFESFFAEVAAYARARRPSLEVTTEVQFFEGYLGNSRAQVQSVMQHADVVGVAYYPLDLEGNVLDPEIIALHFDMLATGFPGKPIHFYQLGYPTSSLLNSSEELQAQFMREMFRAWDAYADQVKLIDYTFLTDLSVEHSDSVGGQFGQESQRFAEFVRTLGLRTFPGDGSDKLGFGALADEAAARGW